MGLRRFALLALLVFVLPVAPAAAQEGADADGDTIQDGADSCPAEHGRGMLTGCPRMTAGLFSQTRPLRGRVQIRNLEVDTVPGAHVTVRCFDPLHDSNPFLRGARHASCPADLEFVSPAERQTLLAYRGELLPATMIIEVTATREGSIGTVARYQTTRRRLIFNSRQCLEPGDTTPRSDCTGIPGGVTSSADDRDADAVSGEADLCPGLHGDGIVTGCPRLRLEWEFNGQDDRGRLRLTALYVRTLPRAATIEVTCSASTTCPRRDTLRTPGANQPTTLRQYRGLLVPRGTVIEVRATGPGHMGQYVRFIAGRRTLRASTDCLEPGAHTPQQLCNGRPVALEMAPPLTQWLNPFPFVEVSGGRFRGGVYLRGISVRDVPSAARASLECIGRGCPPDQTFRPPRGGVVKFRGFPKQFQRDVRFNVRVTDGRRIGLFARIVTGNRWPPARSESCVRSRRRSARAITCPVRP